jgi:hypothetical protein
MTPIEIRRRLGLPRRKITALADVSEPSVRSYELDRNGVTAPIRAKLDPVYAALAAAASEARS